MEAFIRLPPQWWVAVEIAQNPIRQLRTPAYEGDAAVFTLAIKKHEGLRIETGDRSVAVVGKSVDPLPDGDVLLSATKGKVVAPTLDERPTSLRWLKPLPLVSITTGELRERAKQVVDSWAGGFELREETEVSDGLREPQVGAMYAVLAHWSMSADACTVVMPTGTGKTETMLSLLVMRRLTNVLVIVPTDPLREQTAAKFNSLGVLPKLGIVRSGAEFPLVGVLEHGIQDASSAEGFMRSCNVVVATMSAVNECSADARLALANATAFLFMDEAHHIPAATWTEFKSQFPNSRVVQFTATPFRNDGKRVDGPVVYDYPLGRAQAKGMFQRIRFTAVAAFTQESADREIAARAKQQLDLDLAEGFDHLVMARGQSIARAEALLALYQAVAPEHFPVLIHSQQGTTVRRAALDRIRTRASRIVVCVNMLGEGFDLPELKIAALHDPHKSLTITLQFIGRFARVKKDKIGVATAIANVVDQRVEDALQNLYAQDSDWNAILRDLSEHATKKEIARSDFLKRFAPPLDVMPLQNVYPKMSTVVFDVRGAAWNADDVRRALTRDNRSTISINADDQVAIFVERDDTSIRWGDTRELINTSWQLYVIYWCNDLELLFINSSDTSDLYESVAADVVGEDVPLISGNAVFRTLFGIRQLILNTLGLTHPLRNAVRFTMHSGADVKEGLSSSQTLNAIKVNLFGHGYENGETASLGLSRKGRIWSHLIAYDIEDWLRWCEHIGAKLRDDTIKDTTLPENLIVPEPITERPAAVPLTIEWPHELFEKPEELVLFKSDASAVPFFDVGIRLDSHSETGPITFVVELTPGETFKYIVSFDDGMKSTPLSKEIHIQYGKKSFPLSEWLASRPPIIRFHDNSFVAYGELFKVIHAHLPPFSRDEIEVRDWSGVDLTKESQTTSKYADSIQRRVIEEVLAFSPPFGIVFDDDGANEVADVVAIRDDDEFLHVDLYHCKYAFSSTAGARVRDLYEVCGQAQRSVRWRHEVEKMLRHLRYRDASQVHRTSVTRFERGDQTTLLTLSKRARFLRPKFTITIVQPGLSKAAATTGQLDLLAATAAYLFDTFGIPLRVVSSA